MNSIYPYTFEWSWNLKERPQTQTQSRFEYLHCMYILKDLNGLKNILVGAWSDYGQLLRIKFKLTAGSVGLLGYRFLEGYMDCIWILIGICNVSVRVILWFSLLEGREFGCFVFQKL